MNSSRSYAIRLFEAADAIGLSELYHASVAGTGSRYYSPSQIAAWLSRAPSPHRLIELMQARRQRFVAVDNGSQLIGFCDIEADGHIDYLYCAPETVGQGIASALYQVVEDHALKHDFRRLYVEASEAALPLFTRKGFVLLERRDFEINGIAIHNYSMEKQLQAAV